MNEQIQSIEIPMSWKQSMAILILALEAGTPEGKRQAKAELTEIAEKLDRLIEQPPAVQLVTFYRENDSYVAGALWTRKGWHYHYVANSPIGEQISSVIRGPFESEERAIAEAREREANPDLIRQERIERLVKHKAALIEQRVQTAEHGRRARIQEQIDAIAAELEQLAVA